MPNLINSMHIAASGMKTQGDRLRVVSQNISNADSMSPAPGVDPYRRKTITFRNYFDHNLGIERVKTHKYGVDKGEFGRKYEPGHPAADELGYVRTTNVSSIVEMMDMKEAQRSYQANLSVIDVSKQMIMQTLSILR